MRQRKRSPNRTRAPTPAPGPSWPPALPGADGSTRGDSGNGAPPQGALGTPTRERRAAGAEDGTLPELKTAPLAPVVPSILDIADERRALCRLRIGHSLGR